MPTDCRSRSALSGNSCSTRRKSSREIRMTVEGSRAIAVAGRPRRDLVSCIQSALHTTLQESSDE